MIIASGCFFRAGDKAHVTNHWQMVGEFLRPCGRTTQWYLCRGSCLLMLGTENANRGASSGWSGMLKKQSLRSMITSGQSLGIIKRDGSPSWSSPISPMTSLIFLRSWSNLHEPEVFLRITNIGEFQGLLAGFMWPFCNYSLTRVLRALSFFSSGATGPHRQDYLSSRLTSRWWVLQWPLLKIQFYSCPPLW